MIYLQDLYLAYLILSELRLRHWFSPKIVWECDLVKPAGIQLRLPAGFRFSRTANLAIKSLFLHH